SRPLCNGGNLARLTRLATGSILPVRDGNTDGSECDSLLALLDVGRGRSWADGGLAILATFGQSGTGDRE
ncbi:MAG TPA: hypothetical protein VFQ32_04160, partial [Ktedonobacterales bacterium]|nr:hypothetical protein [Ktedonobacterales bacterium]